MYILLILYICIFFLGYKLGWGVFQYDELRLLQILFISICFIKIFKFNINLKNIIYIILMLLFLLFKLNDFNVYQYQDLLILIGFVVIPCALSLEFKRRLNNYFFYHGIYFLIICAVIPTFFIYFSIKNLFEDNVWYDWQMNAGNIRIYDSVVVPIIFLAIYLKISEYKYIQNNYLLIIFLITLGLWFDGARAALLSIIIGVMVLFVFCKDYRKLIVLINIVILLSFLVYNLTFYLYNQMYIFDYKLSVIRTSSSGRLDLWTFVYQKWIENPWKGVGGNYLAMIDYPLNHLHNFYLKLIFEWGVLGCMYLIWIFYQLIKVFASNDVHISIKAGICAIAVDALFSGNLVYPASQMSILLLFSLAFSQYQANLIINTNAKLKYLSRSLIMLWLGLYVFIICNYFLQDLLCWQCGSYSDLMAPGFWYYGKAEHLLHYSKIP